MAVEKRQKASPFILIHHSDRGVQYCSAEYVEILTKQEIAISMTQSGSPYENALAERVNGITFLDDKFEKLIVDEKPKVTKIYPLTLINLNFFIKYYPRLKDERYFLRDSIISYQKQRREKLNLAHKKNNAWLYLTAKLSFIRYIEHHWPSGDPKNYFKSAAKHFGFDEEAGNAEKNHPD
jgi:transposase InsO family protein